ncbi:helix-turn-helix domain-containing protein [Arthrobacter sp. R3-55]
MLTPKARLKLAQLVVGQHWTITEAAKHYLVSWPTAKRWVTRNLEHGPEGKGDKSSRPRRSPKPDPGETGQTHRCPAVAQAAGAGADRRAAGHSGLDRARRPGPHQTPPTTNCPAHAPANTSAGLTSRVECFGSEAGPVASNSGRPLSGGGPPWDPTNPKRESTQNADHALAASYTACAFCTAAIRWSVHRARTLT